MKTNLLFTLTFIFFTGYSYSQTSIATIESEMVLVEGGSMNLQGRLVTLPSYYCSKYEVTQRLFEEVTGYNPVKSTSKIDPLKPIEYWSSQYEPASDLIIFCNELNAYLNLPMVYYKDIDLKIPYTLKDTGQVGNSFMDFNSSGYRLPIGVEWEYAARGGQKSQNYIFSGSNDINEVSIWGSLLVVGSLKPNELGIYNMTGNVSELAFDSYPYDLFQKCVLPKVWVGGAAPFQYRGGSYGYNQNLNHSESLYIPGAIGMRLFRNKN
ncbi:MAG: SUMF1/EgtB/PvdO family nonheme iron enzyme [Saprospiraceae bacterium]|nr:MAG: sulfatase-modifying factor protein [Candidatus Parvibacillus calidus]MCO6461130.1 SUMF1/EgtB/PvdO family nonheme iron enzyme [Saprospiraceae bacterium]WKZ63810.1 MAG: SUMF1/EgtB/PvdO family nonheme iron enzyme [Saprospiraceae bacterium]